MWIYGVIILLGIFAFNGFILLLGTKIDTLEKRIIRKFIKRTNLIPSIFEVSKPYLTKHSDIFGEILKLRKTEFTLTENNHHLHEMIQTEGLIHHELNFIFRACNTHQKLIGNGKFIYLRALIIEKSLQLGKDIDVYRKIVQKYNHLVHINRLCIIGLFIPIGMKNEI